MHNPAKLLRRALLPVCLVCVASSARAVLIDFDSGYTNGATLAGIDDPDVPGTAAWTSSSSGAFVAVGNGAGLAASINGGPGAVVNRLDLSAAVGEGGIDFTKEVQFKADIKVVSLSGTGNALILALGDGGITNPTGNTWFTLTVGGAGSATAPLYLSTGNGAGVVGQTAINGTGANSEFADFAGGLGVYITVDIRFNPVTRSYTYVSINDTDYTAAFSGFTLPFTGSNTSAAYTLSLIKSSSQTAEVHIDNLLVGNTPVPEPASTAALLGLAGLASAVIARRRRRAVPVRLPSLVSIQA